MEKVPLFKSFESMEEGLEKMLTIIDKMKNNDELKIEMIVLYGCLIETHNERVREEMAEEEV